MDTTTRFAIAAVSHGTIRPWSSSARTWRASSSTSSSSHALTFRADATTLEVRHAPLRPPCA